MNTIKVEDTTGASEAMPIGFSLPRVAAAFARHLHESLRPVAALTDEDRLGLTHFGLIRFLNDFMLTPGKAITTDDLDRVNAAAVEGIMDAFDYPRPRSCAAFMRDLEPWLQECLKNDYPNKPWHAVRTERERQLVSIPRTLARAHGPQADKAQFLRAAEEAADSLRLADRCDAQANLDVHAFLSCEAARSGEPIVGLRLSTDGRILLGADAVRDTLAHGPLQQQRVRLDRPRAISVDCDCDVADRAVTQSDAPPESAEREEQRDLLLRALDCAAADKPNSTRARVAACRREDLERSMSDIADELGITEWAARKAFAPTAERVRRIRGILEDDDTEWAARKALAPTAERIPRIR